MKIEFPKLDTDLGRVKLPCQVQPKYDGELAVWLPEQGVLTNRYGTEKVLPLCKELPNIELVGELYWDTGKRNFYQALPKLKQHDPLLKFAVFGMYHTDMTFSEQMKILKLAIQNSDRVSVVEGHNAYSHPELEHYLKDNLKQGWEGSVVKPLMSSSFTSWVKNKPDETIDLLILGVSKKKSAIAVGTPDGKILGHCSLLGQPEIAALVGKENIIGDTKEDYLISPSYAIEVKHLGVIEPSGCLRNPRISRLREDLGKDNL